MLAPAYQREQVHLSLHQSHRSHPQSRNRRSAQKGRVLTF